MKALLFANGRPKNGSMVRRALLDATGAQIIAADGGARIAWRYNRLPDVVVGDMDSLSEEELHQLESQGAVIVRHPREKNETDLELALLYAAAHGATWIRVIGALGGRFDQMLANVYLLAMPQLAHCDVAMVARRQMIRVLRAGTHTLDGHNGDTISLIPISGDVHGITTQGLRYLLENETLLFTLARGISNVMTGASAEITIGEGMLLCVHTRGKA
jgi:thiamine pyrophosphokinase